LPASANASPISSPTSVSPAEMAATRANLLALAHGHRLDVSQVRDDLGHGELDATAQRERVGAGRDVAQAVADDRLSQQRRRRGPVAGDVVGLARTTVP